VQRIVGISSSENRFMLRFTLPIVSVKQRARHDAHPPLQNKGQLLLTLMLKRKILKRYSSKQPIDHNQPEPAFTHQ
jgi:hypothetical protein